MRIIFVIFLSLLIISCFPKPSIDYNIMLMSDKLQHTKWQSVGFSKKQYIELSELQIKLVVGKILGSAYTPFTIIDEDNSYVLYNIYEEYLPSHLGIVQIDEHTIKVLVWQSNTLPQKEEIIDFIKKKGKLFKLIKKRAD